MRVGLGTLIDNCAIIYSIQLNYLCSFNAIFMFVGLFSGETGIGKSTLMDSLFNTSFEATPSPHNLPTVKLKAHTYELQESGVRLKVSTKAKAAIIYRF